ncbi:hypothetical protein GGR53DRAFT_518521 [Hypoxylon sp. FL1150]|nr:hypothetical protein GGR53DRAFT_518521 [Hypoxylon sp. FL1150]
MNPSPGTPSVTSVAAGSILAEISHPNEEQKRRTWTLNHAEWGGALTLDQYLEREPYLTTIPLARDGGMRHWILKTRTYKHAASHDFEVSVLASCESIRKRVLATAHLRGEGRGVTVREYKAYGIGSVFTDPRFRGRGYAGRLLAEVAKALKGGVMDDVACTALWSDIGKQYYAKKGWAAFPSLHFEFSVVDAAAAAERPNPNGASEPVNPAAQKAEKEEQANGAEAEAEAGGVTAVPIEYDDLAALCERDEELLRAQLARTAIATGHTCVAFVPDRDTMMWHYLRDEFITTKIFESHPSSTPREAAVRGAIAGATHGRRVWALWSRSYGGAAGEDPARTVDKNTLYILRLVVELEGTKADLADNDEEDEDVVAAFAAVMRTALEEARAWHLGKIDMWNPSPMAKQLVERSGLRHRSVDREKDSIPSMMWYGLEDIKDIEWVANEKYCWC